MNKLIKEKLYAINKTLLDYKIISFVRMKASLEDNIHEQILFYLRNIERGLNILNENKKILSKKYPSVFIDISKKINDDIKVKAIEEQRKMRIYLRNRRDRKLLEKMNKGLILNKHKDYYQFGYKKKKVVIKYKKVDSYDELRYSDDNEEKK